MPGQATAVRARIGTVHYHTYTWAGPATEYRRRYATESHPEHDRFRSSPVPPIKTAWWLRKPPDLIDATLETPEEAAAWLVTQYRQVADRIAVDTIWTEERHAHAQHDLADGRDITWNWHLDDGSRFFATVVACTPNAWEDAACPLGGERPAAAG